MGGHTDDKDDVSATKEENNVAGGPTDTPAVNVNEIRAHRESADAAEILAIEKPEHNDSDYDEDDIIDLNEVEGSTDRPNNPKRISANDAESIVGGELLGTSPNKKIFAFQLPFGSTFATLKTSFQARLPNIPFLNYIDDDDEVKEDFRLKLSRQESLNTLNEANFFKHHKKRSDVRFRAVKHSLATKYNEFLPQINNSNKILEDYESIYLRIDGNIVVLGGYRGSILRDVKTGKRVWIPIKAGFNLKKINLLLGPDPEDEINASRYLYPDGVLKNIGPVDLCKTLIRRLSANPKTNVKEFGYDWRLSGEHVSDQLVQFLADIYKETGKPTLVICHSMGGLITQRALHKNPKLFRSIIYVGVPSECLNILGPIRTGESVLFLDKILTAEATFMMRSSFNFLPLTGKVFYNRETHEPYILDLFDPDTWVEYNLSPLVASSRLIKLSTAMTHAGSGSTNSTLIDSHLTSLSSRLRSIKVKSLSPRNLTPRALSPKPQAPKSPSPKSPSPKDELESLHLPIEDSSEITFEQAYLYLKEALASAKKFITDLEYKPELENQYPPMAIVYGNTVPSVRGSNVANEQDIKDGNYYDFFYGHGDGVVHQKWLMPERKGFKYYDPQTKTGQVVGKFSTQAGHVNLMTDLKAMGKALNAVYEAEKQWHREASVPIVEAN